MIGSMSRRSAATVAAILICSGLLTGASRGAAVRTPTMVGHHTSSALFTANRPAAAPSQAGLNGTVAISGTQAWAVGGTNAGSTLIMHWNGTAWKHVASPTPTGGGDLLGVAKIPSGGLWAVGYTGANPPEPLILARNGTTWTQTASPSIAGGGYLEAVSATSSTNAWAVGYTTGGATLTLQWNGAAWTQVPSPTPSGENAALYGVAATSSTDAWAVGGSGNNPLILHWDGTSWTQVSTPLSAPNGVLASVAGTSATSLWAVGYRDGSPLSPLILQWNGTAWTQVTSPSPPESSALNSVVATSASKAWAVGYTTTANNEPSALILRWNGSNWLTVTSPSAGANSGLAGVAAYAKKAWAVGNTNNPNGNPLIQAWNGTTWTNVVGSTFKADVPQMDSLARQHAVHSRIVATAQSGDVTVSGPVSCAGLYPPPSLNPGNWFASRVRFQTATGDAADATISGLSYTVTLTGVPAGGETAFAYITCGNDTNPSWGCQFTLTPTGAEYLYLLTHWLAGNVDPPGC